MVTVDGDPEAFSAVGAAVVEDGRAGTVVHDVDTVDADGGDDSAVTVLGGLLVRAPLVTGQFVSDAAPPAA